MKNLPEPAKDVGIRSIFHPYCTEYLCCLKTSVSVKLLAPSPAWPALVLYYEEQVRSPFSFHHINPVWYLRGTARNSEEAGTISYLRAIYISYHITSYHSGQKSQVCIQWRIHRIIPFIHTSLKLFLRVDPFFLTTSSRKNPLKQNFSIHFSWPMLSTLQQPFENLSKIYESKKGT